MIDPVLGQELLAWVARAVVLATPIIILRVVLPIVETRTNTERESGQQPWQRARTVKSVDGGQLTESCTRADQRIRGTATDDEDDEDKDDEVTE